MASACLSLAGCSFGFVASPDELYSLPQLPVQYTELTASINELLNDGAEYAAPVSGSNIQTVQMVDLNGDGTEEALAFMRRSDDAKPLKIYIFSVRGDAYEQTAVIEGSGSAIYSIAYSDLDQDGRLELIVGWKMGTDLQALSVYSLKGKEPQELLRVTSYVKYAITDLNRDKRQELVVLHTDPAGGSIADYYTWDRTGVLSLSSSARISMTMAELSNLGRVKSGMLQGKIPALFVTGVSDADVQITDILTDRNGELINIVLSDTTGVSTEVYRHMSLFPTDINGDGITEVPAPAQLPSRGDADGEPCYRVDWESYDSNGTKTAVESTYHDIDDGWYLVLPSTWAGRIMITRGSSGQDEMAVTFSIRGDKTYPAQDFLRIYTITGDNREIKAVRGNRFILSRQVETTFAAELLAPNSLWQYGITEDQLRDAFNLITTEWLAGDN